MINPRIFLAIFCSFFMLASYQSFSRNLYLNGIDVSSARLQYLEKVSVRIDGDGNIFIIAPHYQVNEESTYIPLSSWKEQPARPAQGTPGVVKSKVLGMDSSEKSITSLPAQQLPTLQQQENNPTDKAGSKAMDDDIPSIEQQPGLGNQQQDDAQGGQQQAIGGQAEGEVIQ